MPGLEGGEQHEVTFVDVFVVDTVTEELVIDRSDGVLRPENVKSAHVRDKLRLEWIDEVLPYLEQLAAYERG